MYIAFSWEDSIPQTFFAPVYFQNPNPGGGYFTVLVNDSITGNLSFLYSPDGITYSNVDSGVAISRQTDTIYVAAVYFGTSGLQLGLYDVSGNQLYNSSNATQFSGIESKYIGYTNIFSPANGMSIKLYKFNFESGNTLTGSPDITGLLAAGPNLLPSYYEFVPPSGFESVRGTYTLGSDATSTRLFMNSVPSSDQITFTQWTGPGFAQSPGFYIRPVVRQTQIRYNWNISSIVGPQNYILTCSPTNGGTGGGTVALSSSVISYTFKGLQFGKTYSAGLNAVNGSSISASSIYRTVTTGNPPGIPTNGVFISTPTTVTLSWNPPAGVQIPPIGWYVIRDGAIKYNTQETTITIPFDETPHTYTIQSVSDTGYSIGLSTIIS